VSDASRSKRSRSSDKVALISLVAFILSCCVFAFLGGVAVGHLRLFPYHHLEAVQELLLSPVNSPHYLTPIRHEKPGVEVLLQERVAPGVTLISSYWNDSGWDAGLRLIDEAGNVLHTWQTNIGQVWPELDRKWLKSQRMGYVHGTLLLENGDIVFNFEYAGLVRIDACGNVKWKLRRGNHHSVVRDEHGDFWVCGSRPVNRNSEWADRVGKFPGLEAPLIEDLAMKVSPDGEVLEEISVLEALYGSGYQRLFWKNSWKPTDDVTHMNKVEPLPAALDGQYPLFGPGDLLLSLRNLQAVLVLDAKSHLVKWMATDPFVSQHDPQFIGDGWIGLFDNNRDGTDTGQVLGGSRIIAIRPDSNEVRVLYSGTPEQPFYTDVAGKFQILPNENLLITEALGGRVFEVTPDGKLVWQWVHEPYSKTHVAEVMEGKRYPFSKAQVASWACR